MKKSLLLAGVAGALLAHNAQAESTLNIKPVVGIDYVYSQIDMDDGDDEFWEDKLNAFALSAGIKFNKYFGVEAFYQQSEEAETNNRIYIYDDLYAVDTTVQYKSYGLDLVGYLPLNQKFDLIGTAGVALYDGEFSVEDFSDSQTEVGFRLGVGAQYTLNEQVSLRLMGRYNYTGIDGAKNMIDVTAGARFYF